MAEQPATDDLIALGYTKARDVVKLNLNKQIMSWFESQKTEDMLVNIAIWIESINNIDEVNETVDIDFYVRYNWIQDHIKLDSLGYANRDSIAPDMVEKHMIYVDNAVSLRLYGQPKLIVEDKENGLVRETRRMKGSIKIQFDYHTFPLDTQNIQLVFQTRKGNVHFECGYWHRNNPKNPGERKHEFIGNSMKFRLIENAEWNNDTRQYVFRIIATRDYYYYFWNVMLLLFIITNFSLLSYGVSGYGDRLSNDITLSLIIIAFLYYAKSKLPKIKYLTLLDKYILLCFGFTIGIALEHFVISVTTHSNDSIESKQAFERLFYQNIAAAWSMFHLAVYVYNWK
eukprot:1163885_1